MVTKFFRLIFLMVLALCDDGVVKSNDFCHKNLSPQTTYNWKKCRGSFTISHLKKLKENVKPPSKISENPLEHSNPYLNNTDWCLGPYLQFLDPPGPLTGLWSIPGSGNYWMRHLIQRASGYMTGTMLNEFNKPGFPGGHIANGSVIVVKDHFVYILHGNNKVQKRINLNVYDRAILLIRNPLDAFIAEFNRDFTKSNTAIVPIEKWLEIDIYDSYENQFLTFWKKFHKQIIDEYKNELILVEYEALKSNVIGELTKVMKFLGLPMTDAIKECIRDNPNGLYKRPKYKENWKEMLVRNGKLQNGHIKLSNHAYEEMVKLLKTKIRTITSKLKAKK